jgi:hypothetical protein
MNTNKHEIKVLKDDAGMGTAGTFTKVIIRVDLRLFAVR